MHFIIYWQHLVLISTVDQQIDVSSYLTPESPHEDFTWEETDTNYVFKLKPTISTRRKGCQCSGSQAATFKHKLLVPEGWGVAEDHECRIWYYDFSQHPHRRGYQPQRAYNGTDIDNTKLAWSILSPDWNSGIAMVLIMSVSSSYLSNIKNILISV